MIIFKFQKDQVTTFVVLIDSVRKEPKLRSFQHNVAFDFFDVYIRNKMMAFVILNLCVLMMVMLQNCS